jgi:hypothetical protein
MITAPSRIRAIDGLLVSLLFALPAVAVGPGPLEGPWQVSREEGAALAAAVAKVRELGYEPSEFSASVECGQLSCEVQLYPRELDTDPNYRNVRGCPLKYCATLTYSIERNSFVSEVGWR